MRRQPLFSRRGIRTSRRASVTSDSPMVTRFFSPPDTPRMNSLPMSVFAQPPSLSSEITSSTLRSAPAARSVPPSRVALGFTTELLHANASVSRTVKNGRCTSLEEGGEHASGARGGVPLVASEQRNAQLLRVVGQQPQVHARRFDVLRVQHVEPVVAHRAVNRAARGAGQKARQRAQQRRLAVAGRPAGEAGGQRRRRVSVGRL